MANWIMPGERVGSLMGPIGKRFEQIERSAPEFFPNLRTDSELVMASDYSGEHVASSFQVLTFLLTDRPGILRSWEAERLAVRRDRLTDGRRMAFKSLSDAQRQRALGPFLEASARINGMLFCVAIQKTLSSSDFGYKFANVGDINASVLSKLTKVALFGSFLVGGLSAAGQNLHWITDEDEIVSNENVQSTAGRIIGAMNRSFCPHGLGNVRLGIAGEFEDDRRAEDLCAIPDLVGGAVAESLTSLRGVIPETAHILTPLHARQSTKTDLILSWLSMLEGPLKYLLCAVRPAGEDQLRFSFASPTVLLGAEVSARLWTPLDKGWRKSLEQW